MITCSLYRGFRLAVRPWLTLIGLFLLPQPGFAHSSSVHGIVAFDVYTQRDVVDVVLANGEDGHYDLTHRRSTDGGKSWGPARPIALGGRAPASPYRGQDPQIAASGDRVVVVWTTTGTSPWGTGPLAAAISDDGGATWSPGPNPADDGSTDGHGFSDVAVAADGAFHVVWLDGRDGGQGLRAARSSDGGRTWTPNRTVDERTCECCWNRLVPFVDELAVLYRDVAPRDMALAVSVDSAAKWQRIGTAGAFDWRMEACPHVGGGLAVTGGDPPQLHALVWTGADEHRGLHALRSIDRGKTWAEARLPASAAARRSDLAANGSTLLAVWEADGAVRATRSLDDGASWQEPATLATGGVQFPLVRATRDGFLVTWTDGAAGAKRTWRSTVVPR